MAAETTQAERYPPIAQVDQQSPNTPASTPPTPPAPPQRASNPTAKPPLRRLLTAMRGLEPNPGNHDPRDGQQHAENVTEERDVIHRGDVAPKRSRRAHSPNETSRDDERDLGRRASCAPTHPRAASRGRTLSEDQAATAPTPCRAAPAHAQSRTRPPPPTPVAARYKPRCTAPELQAHRNPGSATRP
jgi:hypothetical protein